MNSDKLYENWFKKKTSYYMNEYWKKLTKEERDKIKNDAGEFNLPYDMIVFWDAISEEMSYKLTKEYFLKYVLPKMKEDEIKKYL